MEKTTEESFVSCWMPGRFSLESCNCVENMYLINVRKYENMMFPILKRQMSLCCESQFDR
jgi:hypothetical protein